jgi:hypothetical protein
VVKPADADKPAVVNSFMGITGEAETFPTGDLFQLFQQDKSYPFSGHCF